MKKYALKPHKKREGHTPYELVGKGKGKREVIININKNKYKKFPQK